MDIQEVNLDPYVEEFQSEQIECIKAWATGRDVKTPIHLEIGANRGRFLKGLARNCPEHSVIGIEIRRKFVQALQIELEQEGPPNAHMLGADANIALPLIFSDGSVHRVYVLFPDPWWKKRHAKRRLITPRFLNLLADKISPQGLLIIKTDVEQYAQMVQELVDESQRWARIFPKDEDWPQDEPQWPLTTREVRILSEDLPIWKIYAKPTGVLAQGSIEDLPPQQFQKPGNKH
jgi:tRNA (guanine-N7-)-methyltransferase